MNNLLTFINENTSKNAIDEFIKSQILHFYFIYIHPYFDVNGRTSRTTAMWYLLNKKAYPYLFFSRAITFSKDQYKKSILTSIRKGNITVFLDYILKSLIEELKKEEYIIDLKIEDVIMEYNLESMRSTIEANEELFKKYAYVVLNNNRLGNYKEHVLHLFPILANNHSPLEEYHFFNKLKKLYFKIEIME